MAKTKIKRGRRLRELPVPPGAVAGGVTSLVEVLPKPGERLTLGERKRRKSARSGVSTATLKHALRKVKRGPVHVRGLNVPIPSELYLKSELAKRKHKSSRLREGRIPGPSFLAGSEEKGRRLAERRRTGGRKLRELITKLSERRSVKAHRKSSKVKERRSVPMAKKRRTGRKSRRSRKFRETVKVAERKRSRKSRKSRKARRSGGRRSRRLRETTKPIIGRFGGLAERRRRTARLREILAARRSSGGGFGGGLGLAERLAERRRTRLREILAERKRSRKSRKSRRKSRRSRKAREVRVVRVAERKRSRKSRKSRKSGRRSRKLSPGGYRCKICGIKGHNARSHFRPSYLARRTAMAGVAPTAPLAGERRHRARKSRGFRELFLSNLGYSMAERKRRSRKARRSARELTRFASERKRSRKSRRTRRHGRRARRAREMFTETRTNNPGFVDEVVKPGVAALVGLVGTRFIADRITGVAGPKLAQIGGPTVGKAVPVITSAAAAWFAWWGANKIGFLRQYRGLLAIGAGLAVAEELLALVGPTFGMRPGAGALSNAMFGDGVSGLGGNCFVGACPTTALPAMPAESCAACMPGTQTMTTLPGAVAGMGGTDNGMGGNCFVGACPTTAMPAMPAEACAACVPGAQTVATLPSGVAGLGGCCCNNQQQMPVAAPTVVAAPGPATGTAGLGLAAQIAINNAGSSDPMVNSILAGLSGKAQDILNSVNIN
jgi:hypothetical protein